LIGLIGFAGGRFRAESVSSSTRLLLGVQQIAVTDSKQVQTAVVSC